MSVSVSGSARCPYEYGYPTCSGAVSSTAKLGKLSANSSISVSPPSGSVLYSEQETFFLDEITVTSSTLPNGTPVKIKETVNLTGASNIDCLGAGGADGSYAVYSGVAENFTILTGGCGDGIPVSPAKGSLKFNSSVGSTFSLAPELSSGPYIPWGPDSASLQLQVVYHLKSITPNVTLASASGTVY